MRTPSGSNLYRWVVCIGKDEKASPGPDLAPGQTRQVDITFTPPAAGAVNDFVGTLTVTATNLGAPKTIHVTGHRLS